jgi:hypothetical protein
MRKLLALGLLLVAAGGCMSVDVAKHHKRAISSYRRDGSLERAKNQIGYTVNPVTTFFWGLIPGANKIHIARKIEQSRYRKQFERDYPGVTGRLWAGGCVCATFSWIPFVYEFTMPCQVGSGVYPDVARVNNLMWMYHIESR